VIQFAFNRVFYFTQFYFKLQLEERKRKKE